MKFLNTKPVLDIFSKTKIFSKKESKNDFSKGKIIADYREKNSFVPAELIKLNVEIEFKELKVADYIVKDVAIERKTVSDFVSSMINKRLSKQIEELQQYKNKLLVVEGIDEQELYSNEDVMYSNYAISQEAIGNRASGFRGKSKKTRGLSSNAIRGFLLSIVLKHKIPLIFTKNAEDTAKFIFVLLNKRTKEVSLNAKKKSLNKKEQMQFIIEGFPGIGPKNAKNLLKEFKTIKNIINASQEELENIIGKKSEIFKIVRGEY